MTFEELSLMAFRNDPLPRFAKLPHILGCKIFIGVMRNTLFRRNKPQKERKNSGSGLNMRPGNMRTVWNPAAISTACVWRLETSSGRCSKAGARFANGL